MVKFIFYFLWAGLLMGCASPSTPPCADRDWYEIGRRDGARGADEGHWSRHTSHCERALSPHTITIYNNGRQAGLVEFCSPENAFHLGKVGRPAPDVCPDLSRDAFRKAYVAGQQADVLEQEIRVIDQRIDSLLARLQSESTPSAQAKDIHAQISELRRARARNEKELRSPAGFSTQRR